VPTYPYAFAVGEPTTYVQAPKAKGRQEPCLLRLSNSPITGLLGLFAGAHRKCFPSNPVEEIRTMPSASSPQGHILALSRACDDQLCRLAAACAILFWFCKQIALGRSSAFRPALIADRMYLAGQRM
jgi:hypothetical protein